MGLIQLFAGLSKVWADRVPRPPRVPGRTVCSFVFLLVILLLATGKSGCGRGLGGISTASLGGGRGEVRAGDPLSRVGLDGQTLSAYGVVGHWGEVSRTCVT